MPLKNNYRFINIQLIFLLIFGTFWNHCHTQENIEQTNKPPDGQGEDGGAFFALRSCHQLLTGDSGDFFSPDYLCSNPPLWCNWTIVVEVGKRINLHLEDMTSEESCLIKQDQLHVDEPEGHTTSHKVLQKCWQEAKFTSVSNTLYVVLLIGGWPSAPYRGLYGRYQAFGQPAMYHPQEGVTADSQPAMEHKDLEGIMNGENMDPDSSTVNPDSESESVMYDYYDQKSAVEGEDRDSEVVENDYAASENYNHVSSPPTDAVPTQGTPRSGRMAADQTPNIQANANPQSEPRSTQLQHEHELQPTASITTAKQRDEETVTTHSKEAGIESSTRSQTEEENSDEGGNKMEASVSSEQQFPGSSVDPEQSGETQETFPQPNMVEPLSDHRDNHHMRNLSEIAHLPGNHLYEVAVEMNFIEDLDQSWDSVSKLLMHQVKALISERLEALKTPLHVSPKRIKRLRLGALYILWLQTVKGPSGSHGDAAGRHGDVRVHNVVRSAMMGLIAMGISVPGMHQKATVISVSTGDVNECGLQLVLCDSNADCVDQFGSYSCVCRPGFQDASRLGSGGTVCVDVKETATKGVYVLFFVLSSVLVMLLAAAAMFYHRHHRGAFLVRCHSDGSLAPSNPKTTHRQQRHHRDDGYSVPSGDDVIMPPLPPPPPPPPNRGYRDSWNRCPVVDLPLLRFSPLLPDVGMETQKGGRK